MRKKKELENLTLKEFTEIVNDIKTAFEFDKDILELSRKYVEKQLLFEYLSTGATYLSTSVSKLLNKVFLFSKDDDLFDWWCVETEFGKKFKVGDLEDTSFAKNHKFRHPDLSTTEGLYDYCVELYNKTVRQAKKSEEKWR